MDTNGMCGQLEGMTITAVRRLLTRFERAADKNQDQRSKWPDDPTKYVPTLNISGATHSIAQIY